MRAERERDAHVRAAFRPVGRARHPVVGARDRGDDREPEPGSRAAARVAGAAEALEGVLEELLRDASALVAHVELERAVRSCRGERDRAAAVTERVVDEIAERLLDAQAVERGDKRLARAD